LAEADVDRLRRWVAHAPGPLALFLDLHGVEGFRRVILRAFAGGGVRYDVELLKRLAELPGVAGIRVLGSGEKDFAFMPG
jgi:hypothetical protein